MKECLRLECKEQFEPNKPKQVFCSAKCRVYYNRAEKKKLEKQQDIFKPVKETVQKILPTKKLHKKNDDPTEGSNAFFLKYGVFSYAEIKNV